MRLSAVLTYSGKATSYIKFFVLCCALMGEERMTPVKRRVAVILHVYKDHKDQTGDLNVQQSNPWDLMQCKASAHHGIL